MARIRRKTTSQKHVTTDNDSETKCLTINNMSELSDYLQAVPETAPAREMGHQHFRSCEWSEITGYMKTGWQAGTSAIMDQLDVLETGFRDERSGFQWSDTGQFFDVGAVLSGEPEHWLDDDYQPTRKFAKVVCNVTASGGVNAKELEKKGAAILALIDYLQRAGFLVELEVVTGVQREGEKAYTLQKFGTTPLDWDAASLAIGHPGYFRRLTWGVLHLMLGSDPGSYSCWEPSEYRSNPNIIYIPSGDLRRADTGCWVDSESITEVVAWVKSWAEKALTLDTSER